MEFFVRLASPQTNVGYQFFDDAGSLIGSRTTFGVVATPEPGSYSVTVVPPVNASGIYWTTADPQVYAQEPVRRQLTPEEIAVAVGVELGTLPTIPEILEAAGTLSPGIIARIEASHDIMLASPYIHTDLPVIVSPAEENVTSVYFFTEDIVGQKHANIPVTFKLAATPTRTTAILESSEVVVHTDPQGFAQIFLNSGIKHRVTCLDVGLDTDFTPVGLTFDLATMVT